MTRSVDSQVEASLLVWARKTARMDEVEAAKKIGITVDRLREWEEGSRQPTFNQLLGIAQIYKRPVAVFYLPKPPKELEDPFTPLQDFRRFPDTEEHGYSTALVFELRKAESRRETISELMEELGDPIPEFTLKGDLTESPEKLAQRIRFNLRITFDEQVRWKDQYEAFRAWTHALEKQGVLVFQTGFYQGYTVELEEMRGIAISHPVFPLILINSKDSPSAKIFTLMHEFCHLLLRISSINNEYLDTSRATLHDTEIEQFCNQFAAEILVPNDRLLDDPDVTDNRNAPIWDANALRRIANRFKVSKEVILRRLLNFQLTTQQFYKEMREQFEEEYAQYQADRKEGSGAPPYHYKFVRCHGTSYVSTVLDAYQSGIISISEASGLLGSQVKHFTNIQNHLLSSLS